MNKEDKLHLLQEVFTPMSPIKQRDFFIGRINQLTQICDAINEKGQHAILYGERGVGKTSLANIMTTFILNIIPVKVTCNRQDDFRSLWERVFDEIKITKPIQGIGFKPQQLTEIIRLGDSIRAIDELRPSDVQEAIRCLPKKNYLFVFDEFDNITTKKLRSTFADLIKSFSDNIDNCTIVLVGIADNIEDLIGSHPSLERCIKQVKMPLMSDEESAGIIDKGLAKLSIRIEAHIREKIIEFSSGFPHYVHLLSKYGAKELIENEKSVFNDAYLQIAISNGIENTSEQLRNSFQKAIMDSKEKSKWLDVLNACAFAKTDKFSCFTISNVLEQYNKFKLHPAKNGNLTYNLNQLCTKERGDILKKLGKGSNTKFRFINPLMKAFVKLKINSPR